MSPSDTEAARQQALLRAIRSRGETTVPGLLPLPGQAGGPASLAQGLAGYRAHAGTQAERALAAAYPVLRQLLGEQSFAAMARWCWQTQPPRRGDLGWFGDGLADALERAPAARAARVEAPYLPDVARLEWAVHRAGTAADHEGEPHGLALLGECDPAALGVRLVPGAALLASRYPVVAIWQAHQLTDGVGVGVCEGEGEGEGEGEPRAEAEGRFAGARAALVAGEGQHALVWRRGWRVEVAVLAAGDAAFTGALHEGACVAEALQRAEMTSPGPFSFEAWLLRALREGWLAEWGEIGA